MKSLKKKTIKILEKKNSVNYNLLKTIEELNELSTVLLQKINKPERINDEKIINEIGDVQIRLWWLKSLYDTYKIKERIIYKLTKLNKRNNVNNK